MPSGADSGMGIQAAEWNANPYTGLDPQITQYLSAGDFNNAFKSALAAPNVGLYGNTQLRDLLNSSYLKGSGVNWNSTNINDYYSALGQYGSKIDPALLGDIASHGGNAQASNGNGGHSMFMGGALGITPAQIAAAEKANLAAGGAPNALQYDYSPNFQNGHLGGVFGDITSGIGAAVPVITTTAIIGGLAAATGGAAGAALGGGLAGGVAAGAAGGAAAAAGSDVINNQPLTLGSVGKGAIRGAATGGLGYAAAPLTSSLTNAGLNSTLASGIVNAGAGALTGAVSGAISGQGAGAGALSGAEHGALNTASNAVAGSIFGGSSTVNPNLTQAANPNMGDTSAFDSSYFDPSLQTPTDMGGMYNPAGDPNSNSFNGSYDPASTFGGQDPYLSSLLGGLDPNYQVSNQYLNDPSGGGSSGGGILSGLGSKLLSSLLGHGSSGNGTAGGGSSGGSNSLLASLLNGGLQFAGGKMNQQQGITAATNLANQAKFNPYSVNTGLGSTTFGPNGAMSSLSAGNQRTDNGLQGLAGQATSNLIAGPQAASQNYYNQLQNSQRDANNKFFQNNLDSQFANGVLGSTAGQYQSQAALNNISQQGLNDQVLANNFGQQQQQQQLANLTGSLNGMNNFNQQQLSQIGAGGALGADQSNANAKAYYPLYDASKGSVGGTLLGSLGSNGNLGNGASNWLQSLFGGGG